MYKSMNSACEELRNLDHSGTKDAGRLFRIAMEKKGIFGPNGVPIEYARAQVETPGKEVWDHAWTR
jgi:large subunit ribosomal protein L40